MNFSQKEVRNVLVIEKDEAIIDTLKQTIALMGFGKIEIKTDFNFNIQDNFNSTLFININQLEYVTNWLIRNKINPQVVLYQTKNNRITNFWNNGFLQRENVLQNVNSGEVYIKTNKKLEKIFKKDILYIESDKKYCTIITTQKKYVIRTALKNLDEQLSDKKFIRVHRSYLINQEHIEYIDTQNLNVVIGTEKIAIGRRYQEELYNQLMILH